MHAYKGSIISSLHRSINHMTSVITLASKPPKCRPWYVVQGSVSIVVCKNLVPEINPIGGSVGSFYIWDMEKLWYIGREVVGHTHSGDELSVGAEELHFGLSKVKHSDSSLYRRAGPFLDSQSRSYCCRFRFITSQKADWAVPSMPKMSHLTR